MLPLLQDGIAWFQMNDCNFLRCNAFRAVTVCLRIVIALQCIGVAGRYVLSENETESDIFGLLFFDLGWPENVAQMIDDAGGWGCLLSAIVLIITGLIFSSMASSDQRPRIRWVRFIDSTILIFVTVWSISLAVSQMIRGGLFAELTLAEQAVRFVAPATLFMLLYGSEKEPINLLRRVGTELLLVATVTTFVVHGYQALQVYGPFVDLILLSDQRLFHFGVEQQTAENFLLIIGWTDIAVATLILLTRWKFIAIYMFIWGLLTAISRMTAFGIDAWPETAIRAANAGAPLVLFFLFRFSAIRKKSEQRVAAQQNKIVYL